MSLKIGLFSDSHGHFHSLLMCAERLVDADMYLHAGDYIRDANDLAIVTGKECIGVTGNCDYPLGEAATPKMLDLAGWKIMLVHGHQFGVKHGIDKLYHVAEDCCAEIVVYGHTHNASLYVLDGKTMFINPGSCFRSRNDVDETYAWLQLDENLAVSYLCRVEDGEVIDMARLKKKITS